MFSSLLKILFSNKLTTLLLFLFAFSMAYATFMENDFGTHAARINVYEAWWFEFLMFLLALNFIGNIFKYRLFKKEKISILLFHLAFIIILLGAFITRYTGYEGSILIREGESSHHLISQQKFLQAHIQTPQQQWNIEQALNLSLLNPPNFAIEIGQQENPVLIKTLQFIPQAIPSLEDGDNEIIELVSSSEGSKKSFFLEKGKSIFINKHEIAFDNHKEGICNITTNQGKLFINSSEKLNFMIMANQMSGSLAPQNTDTLRQNTLYQSAHYNFVINKIHTDKQIIYQSKDSKETNQETKDLLFVEIVNDTHKKQLILSTKDAYSTSPQNIAIGEYTIVIAYGPKIDVLPFDLHLSNFELERYPGSSSPSSYSSEVIVKDKDRSFSYTIFMNNVLDYHGYRFFQASYDLDEKGTILSVNRDYWGTRVTYLGYILMGLGMLFTLFGKHSRFKQVTRKLNHLQLEKASILILFGFFLFSSQDSFAQPPSLEIEAAHAQKFGALMVQDMDGRIKPMNTLASEFLRKISRKSSFTLIDSLKEITLNENQVFLSIHVAPQAWQNIPLIKVDKEKGKAFLEKLNLEGKSFISFQDLLDEEENYRLSMMIQTIKRKKLSEYSEVDKEAIKVDERFNILFQALSGNYLKIFPQATDKNNAWYNSNFFQAGFSEEDSLFVRNVLPSYFQDIRQAQLNNNWSIANEKLNYIQTFQKVMGKEVIPEEARIKAELLYNDLKLFNRLFSIYWLLGLYMLSLALIKVFIQKSFINIAYKIGIVLIALAFLAQTFNMILRWYAADYPPWSNGYEMIIFVSWSLFFFGFLFFKKSDFIMPLVSLFGGTLLFVAFLDWLNPEITNLVPVLKSYWLKIHVAVIVSSYAPLALSALLGILSLIFVVIHKEKFKRNIKELTYINELSMTIGLFLLAIGTFLGGVWANESWGRYWAWDPKETWALISIMVYAIVLHLRLIPKMKNEYVFNVASIIAFFSIIMTSFGVNYYLSGLHSYAQGDPIPIPQFVYWTVSSLFLLMVIAYYRDTKKKINSNTKNKPLLEEEVI